MHHNETRRLAATVHEITSLQQYGIFVPLSRKVYYISLGTLKE